MSDDRYDRDFELLDDRAAQHAEHLDRIDRLAAYAPACSSPLPSVCAPVAPIPLPGPLGHHRGQREGHLRRAARAQERQAIDDLYGRRSGTVTPLGGDLAPVVPISSRRHSFRVVECSLPEGSPLHHHHLTNAAEGTDMPPAA